MSKGWSARPLARIFSLAKVMRGRGRALQLASTGVLS